MTVLAITSQKGGVGKTTVSVNLAYSLARRGWNTLLVDTDPQGSVGLSLSEKARKCKGLYDAVNSGASAEGMILGTRLPELKILTSGKPHGYFEAVQPGIDGVAAMRRVVDDLRGRKQFDVVLIDTPAGLQGMCCGWRMRC